MEVSLEEEFLEAYIGMKMLRSCSQRERDGHERVRKHEQKGNEKHKWEGTSKTVLLKPSLNNFN